MNCHPALLDSDYYNDILQVLNNLVIYSCKVRIVSYESILCRAGEILYEEMQIAVAFVLGYRLSANDSITCSSTAESNHIEQWLRQDQKLSPVGWEDLSMVPRLDELGSVAVQSRLERDLPADAASTGADRAVIFY